MWSHRKIVYTLGNFFQLFIFDFVYVIGKLNYSINYYLSNVLTIIKQQNLCYKIIKKIISLVHMTCVLPYSSLDKFNYFTTLP